MGPYGGLPTTGAGAVTLWGLHIAGGPLLAIIGAVLIVGGFLLLRQVRPARAHASGVGYRARPGRRLLGRARHRR